MNRPNRDRRQTNTVTEAELINAAIDIVLDNNDWMGLNPKGEILHFQATHGDYGEGDTPHWISVYFEFTNDPEGVGTLNINDTIVDIGKFTLPLSAEHRSALEAAKT